MAELGLPAVPDRRQPWRKLPAGPCVSCAREARQWGVHTSGPLLAGWLALWNACPRPGLQTRRRRLRAGMMCRTERVLDWTAPSVPDRGVRLVLRVPAGWGEAVCRQAPHSRHRLSRWGVWPRPLQSFDQERGFLLQHRVCPGALRGVGLPGLRQWTLPAPGRPSHKEGRAPSGLCEESDKAGPAWAPREELLPSEASSFLGCLGWGIRR